jgi:hypothetical protein
VNEEPLIWTSKGNVPIASLRYEHAWEDTADAVIFREAWFTADGELVKNNCHALAKKQLSVSGEQFSGTL